MNDHKLKISFEPVRNDHECDPLGTHHRERRENDLGKTLPLMVFYVGITVSILLFLFLGGNDGDDSSGRLVVSVQAAGQQTPDTPTPGPTPGSTPTPTDKYSHGSRPTTGVGGEWPVLNYNFPDNLYIWETRVTGAATEDYRCADWAAHHVTDTTATWRDMLAAGDQDIKMEIIDVRAYLASHGYIECASNDPDVFIHVWGKSDASYDGGFDIKHFARKFTDGPPGTDHLIESKLGPYIRITHEKHALDGPNSYYGDEVFWFKKLEE